MSTYFSVHIRDNRKLKVGVKEYQDRRANNGHYLIIDTEEVSITIHRMTRKQLMDLSQDIANAADELLLEPVYASLPPPF